MKTFIVNTRSNCKHNLYEVKLIDACKSAKVRPYRLHDMRHTFNTNMRKAGVDQVVIMKLTGHKTNEKFLRYSHIDQVVLLT
jgi:integrase